METVLAILGVLFGLVGLGLAVTALNALRQLQGQLANLQKQLEGLNANLAKQEKQIQSMRNQAKTPAMANPAWVPLVGTLLGAKKNGLATTLLGLGWQIFQTARAVRKEKPSLPANIYTTEANNE